MGFRCPRCKKDFDLDSESLFKHFEENSDCRKEAVGVYADRFGSSSCNDSKKEMKK